MTETSLQTFICCCCLVHVPSANIKVYYLYCSQPPGGDIDDLTSVLRTTFCGSNILSELISSSSSAPSIQIFSFSPSQYAGRHLLICLVSGLTSPLQDVLWWVDDILVTSASTSLSEEEGGAYRATSVWEVLAADWRSGSVFCCGTVQEGRVYRQRLCPHDRHGSDCLA